MQIWHFSATLPNENCCFVKKQNNVISVNNKQKAALKLLHAAIKLNKRKDKNYENNTTLSDQHIAGFNNRYFISTKQ